MQNEDTFSLSELLQLLKSNYKKIAVFAFAMAFIGLMIGFLSKNEFTSTIKVIPESEDKTGGLSGISDLAAFAGINLNSASNGNSLNPRLYPQILRSPEFLYELSQKSIVTNNRVDSIGINEYFTKIYEPPLTKKLFKWFGSLRGNQPRQLYIDRSNQVISIDPIKWEMIDELNSRIEIFVDEISGVVNLKCKMQDPVASATLTSQTYKQLYNYINNSKTRKARIKLKFIAGRYQESKNRYDSLLNLTAKYQDQNRNSAMESYRTQYIKIENELTVATNLQTQLAGQYETAKIELLNNTPLFEVIQKPMIPLKKSSPKRLFLLMGGFISGLFLGMFFIIIKNI